MFDIQLSGKAPIYEQLYSGIAQLISAEKLVQDEKLPAVREVAKQLGINPNTVQKAYAMLEQAGLIYSIPAKGSYVAQKTDAVEAIRADAVKRLEGSLSTAYKSGITKEETIGLVNKVWSDDRKGGEK